MTDIERLRERLATALWKANTDGAWGEAIDTIERMTDDILAALGPDAARMAAALGEGDGPVYRERAELVSVLARLFPSSLERSDPSSGFEYVVYVDLPAGQVSWHLADSDIDLFEGVPRGQGREWDGHDAAEKSRRLAALAPGAVVTTVEDVADALAAFIDLSGGEPAYVEMASRLLGVSE